MRSSEPTGFDDTHCETTTEGLPNLASQVARKVMITDGAWLTEDPADPHARALQELMARIGKRAPNSQKARFVASVKHYLYAQMWESFLLSIDVQPNPGEYLHVRMDCGAALTCIRLFDIATKYAVPDAEIFRQDVESQTRSACDLIGLSNDVISHSKEIAENSGRVIAMPTVLMADRGIDFDDAIVLTLEMYEAKMEKFVSEDHRLRLGARDELLQYLDGLKSWVSGNLAWSLETGRY